jgi:hypothetical protein
MGIATFPDVSFTPFQTVSLIIEFRKSCHSLLSYKEDNPVYGKVPVHVYRFNKAIINQKLGIQGNFSGGYLG